MKKYVCNVCGWIYDPAIGIPEDGIPARSALCRPGKDTHSPRFCGQIAPAW